MIRLFLIIFFFSVCVSGGDGVLPIFGGPTSTPLPTPQAGITPAPDENAAITKYLEALQQDDFETMFSMLTQASRDATTLEDFSVLEKLREQEEE